MVPISSWCKGHDIFCIVSPDLSFHEFFLWERRSVITACLAKWWVQQSWIPNSWGGQLMRLFKIYEDSQLVQLSYSEITSPNSWRNINIPKVDVDTLTLVFVEPWRVSSSFNEDLHYLYSFRLFPPIVLSFFHESMYCKNTHFRRRKKLDRSLWSCGGNSVMTEISVLLFCVFCLISEIWKWI